jgi:hypothetical protein
MATKSATDVTANVMDFDDPSTRGVMIGLVILTFVLSVGVCFELL